MKKVDSDSEKKILQNKDQWEKEEELCEFAFECEVAVIIKKANVDANWESLKEIFKKTEVATLNILCKYGSGLM
uniref:Uncharacterized protein n=1 Tax=Cucumis sativus TaxID=3659 RepID=A0A0A0KRU9_CUCSA